MGRFNFVARVLLAAILAAGAVVAMACEVEPGLLEQGQTAASDGRLGDASTAFSGAINEDPNNPDPYLARGDVYMQRGEPDRAVVDYGQYIRLSRSDATGYLKRGQAYLELREYDKALLDLNEALKLDASLAAAYVGRAKAYLAVDRPEQALSDLDRATTLTNRSAEVYALRAKAHLALGAVQQALRDANESVTMDGSLALAFAARAAVYAASGNDARMREDYAKALDLGYPRSDLDAEIRAAQNQD
ncbi:MAG: tetratricopeptide repeat protein [SAR202 cluster bacterium]|nr:tetratricopeptide repeat protein [SAR202 cluster bacterium]